MPGADDILGAMREAGAEFARMADAIESRLPSIGEALSKAPAHLKPLKSGLEEMARIAAGIGVDRLIDQLGEAGNASAALLKSMMAVQDSLDAVAGKAASAASAYFDITSEAKKSAQQVDELVARMDKFGDSLAKRNEQAEELHRRVRDAAEKFVPPRADAGGMPRRNAAAVVGDEDAKNIAGFIEEALRLGKTSEEIAALVRDKFRGMGRPLADVQHNFAEIEAAVQGLSGPINQARADLEKMVPEEMTAWGRSAAAAVGEMARQAEAMPDISPVDAADLRELQTALVTMDQMADKPDEMRAAMLKFRKQIEDVKNVGTAFNRELGQQIEHLSDETKRWYGLSRKDSRELAGWQAKHIRAAELNIQKGMNATYAYGMELGRALKDTPVRALSGAVDELGKLTKGLISDLTGVGEFTYTGLAKAFVSVGDEIKRDRQELMRLTADAGLLSSMFQAGMGAPEMTAEYEKLRQSMNNMLGRWGKTREESVASMRALTEAGFSMSSILGPTLKETEGGLWAFARAGEHAMTGLEELAKVSVVTGKDMGEIAALAGQWREKLGVSVGEVGETYLELESAARRSGLSVGKFMDRVMASASGFVLFGGRVDEVADSLSGMMAGMRLPPGLAADVASDFMQRLSGITMEEAATGVAMVGKAGTDALVRSAQEFKDKRDKDTAHIKEDMAKLDKSGLPAAEYAKKKGDLQAKLEKSEEESALYGNLLLKASQGDAGATWALYQEEAQRGHASARRLKLLQDAATMGIKAEDLQKKGATLEEGLLKTMTEMEGDTSKRWLLEQQAKAAGYKSWKEMKEIVRGEARSAETRRAWKDAIQGLNDADKEAFDIMAETGDVEGLAKMLEEKAAPDELVKKMLELREKGLAIGDTVIEDMEKAKGDAGKMAKIAAKAIAGAAKEKMPTDEQIAAEAAKQTSLQEKIDESLNSIKKWMFPIVGVLFAIKTTMDIGQFLSKDGLKSLSALGGLSKKMFGSLGRSLGGLPGKIFGGGRLAKAFGGLKSGLGRFFGGGRLARAFGAEGLVGRGAAAAKAAGGRLAGLVGRGAAAAKAAGGRLAGGVGGLAGKIGLKSIGAVATKLAAPLALAAAAAALVGSIKKMSDTYGEAKERALKDGKTEAEARRIAIAGLKDMGAAKDIIASGLSWVVGDWLGEKIAGALTWIPGFEGAWSDIVDVAMVVADGLSGFWSMVKPVLVKGLFKSLKVLLLPLRLLWNVLKPVVKILFQFGRLLGGLFSGNFDVVGDAIKMMGKALWDGVKGIGGVLWDALMFIPNLVWDGIKGLSGLIWNAFSSLPGLIWDGIKGVTGLIWDGIKDVPSDIASSLGDVGGWIWKKIKSMLPWPFGGGGGDDDAEAAAEKVKEEAAAKAEKAAAETAKYQQEYEAGMTAENKARLEAIRLQRQAAPAASPLSVGGPVVAAPQVLTPEARDLNAAASSMQAAREGEKSAAAGAKTVTDNSTWNVHINSRSEKELQDAMLKTLVKHQQRLAN